MVLVEDARRGLADPSGGLIPVGPAPDRHIVRAGAAIGRVPRSDRRRDAGHPFGGWLGGLSRNPGVGDRMQSVGQTVFAVTEAVVPLASMVTSIIVFVG